jgi:HSP20 family protein
MNMQDDSRRQQQAAPHSMDQMQQGTAPQQQGSQAQQGGGDQQGSGSTSATSAAQQDQFSPSTPPQGNTATRRGGGGLPSIWGRGGPFEMMRRLDEDMDRLFHQFWGGGRNLMRGGRGSEAPAMWMPQLEMCEREGKFHVFADLPGLKKEDVKLSIDGDQLVIQGERRSSHEDGGQQGGYYQSERSYGSFYRSLPLPEGVDASTVDASFKDGVLDVCFDAPRRPQQKSRQVEIK